MRELLRGVVVQTIRDAEAVAQGPREEAGARGRADEREVGHVEPDGARGRPLADDDVEEEVLHRRVEHLLDLVVETMDLVHEEDVVLAQVGEDGREVAGALDGRPGGGVQLGAHLVRDDARERGLAQTRRTRKDHVVERLVAVAGGLDEHAQVLADALLAAVVVECLGAKRAVDLEVVCGELAGHRARARLAAHRALWRVAVGKEVVFWCLPH